MRTLLRASVTLLRVLRPQSSAARSLPPGGHRAKYTDRVRPRLVLSGMLSWLGLSQETEPEHDLVITIKRGILAAQDGDLKKADQMFHIALKMAIDLGHEDAVTHIYILMANTALERGFVGQAERLFTDILKRLLANGEAQSSNAVVEISLKLAEIFLRNGNYVKAEQGFEFCTKTQQLKVATEGTERSEDTLALYGLSLDRRAQFLLGRGRLAEAEAEFNSAVEISRQVHGEKHEQTLVIQNSLATVLSLKGDHTKSISLLTDLVSRAEETSCQYLPTFLINRGIVQLRAGLGARAEADCSRARDEARSLQDVEVTDEALQCLSEIRKIIG